MRSTLRTAERVGQSTIEVSNSSGDFWTALAGHDIYQHNYSQYPVEAGQAIIDEITRKHWSVSTENGGTVDLVKSYHLVLEWDRRTGTYKLFQYSLRMPDKASLEWSKLGRRLVGRNVAGQVILEWYGESGGQLKYYPFCASALWSSPLFTLEPLPQGGDEYGVKRKAAVYFPAKWSWASTMS